MNLGAFTPLGSTVVLPANSTAPTGVQAPVSTGLGSAQYHFVNTGTQIVYIAWGATAAAAQTAAVIPTAGAGNQTATLALMPNSVSVYSLPAGSFFSGITPALGLCNVLITPGEGL